MEQSIYQLITIAIAFVGVIGGIIARDRFIIQYINTANETMRETMRHELDNLHSRVNATRDGFVRRDDLDGHLRRMETNIKEMREEQRETNKRLDAFMGSLAKSHVRLADNH